MTTAATSLLGLALPVTGELAGTWGTTVNDSITSLLDTAVAGTTTLSTDGDVTLSTTTLAANQARQAILLCSGARTALRTITAPAQSKIYTIINATTGGYSVKLVGAGPTTGVTIVAGESALVAWNGSDFIKISNTGGAASFTNVTVSGTTTLSGLTASTALALNASKEVVSVTNTGTGNNVLSASPTLTGTIGAAALTLSSDLTLSGGTANGVLYLNGSKVATSGSALTFDGTTTFKISSSSGYLRSENLAGTVAAYVAQDGLYSSGTNLITYAPASYSHLFYVNAAEAMRLTSTGLGIGTSSPNTKLQVNGNAVIGNGTVGAPASGYQLRVTNDGSEYYDFGRSSSTGYFTINASQASPYRGFIWAYGGTSQMTLDSSGNLGLGAAPVASTVFGGTTLYVEGYLSGTLRLKRTAATATTCEIGAGNGYLGFSSDNSTVQMRLDSSGNLGLGVTPSAWGSGYKSLDIGSVASFFSDNNVTANVSANQYIDAGGRKYKTTNYATMYQQYNGQHQWYNAASGTAGNAISFTQAMTLDASGNLLVGLTSGTGKFEMASGSGTSVIALRIRSLATNSNGFQIVTNSTTDEIYLNNYYSAAMLFGTNNTERARIDSSGNLLVGATAAVSSERFYVNGSNAGFIERVYNSNASPSGVYYYYSGAAPNGTGNYFIECDDTGGIRFGVRSNGGIANYQANDVNLSDRREKTNFAPAGEYLSKICAIPVQTFNYIDQSEDDPGLTLGVVAQDVQAVAPELVMESNWAKEGEEPKMRLSIYQTDLQYALMKCIQEQQAIIEQLTARVAQLESK